MVVHEELERHLKKSFRETQHIMQEEGTTAFRWYDWFLEEVPLTIEQYGAYMLITDRGMNYRVISKDSVCAIVSHVTGVSLEHILVLQEGQPGKALAVEPQAITEHGLTYTADIRTMPTPDFSLHYNRVRLLLLGIAKGCKVLNGIDNGTWSYVAEAGGASQVVSVAPADAEVCAEADTHANVEVNAHTAVEAGAKAEPLSFDLVITMNQSEGGAIPDLQQMVKVGGYLFIMSQYDDSYPLSLQRGGGDLREVTGGLIPPGFSKKRFSHRFWLWQKK